MSTKQKGILYESVSVQLSAFKRAKHYAERVRDVDSPCHASVLHREAAEQWRHALGQSGSAIDNNVAINRKKRSLERETLPVI